MPMVTFTLHLDDDSKRFERETNELDKLFQQGYKRVSKRDVEGGIELKLDNGVRETKAEGQAS